MIGKLILFIGAMGVLAASAAKAAQDAQRKPAKAGAKK